MSAPTPAPGDDRPREGYYPDPSIPGYVRYWNGAAWVPGTSRPAPSDGEPLSPPPGAGPALPTVEETGPHFFDEDPEPGPASQQPSPAEAQHGSRPEPASAWGADRSRQAGFGGEPDRRVSWGSPRGADPRDPRVPGPAEPADEGGAARTAGADGTAAVPPADSDASPGTMVFRRPAGAVRPAGAEAVPSEGTMTFRAPLKPRTGQQSGGTGAAGSAAEGAAGPASGPASGPAFGAPRTSAQAAAQQALGIGHQASAPEASAAPTAPAASATPAATAAPSTPSAPQPSQPRQPSPTVRPQSPAPAPAPAPSPSLSGAPMAPGSGGGQPSWAQQVHRLADVEGEQPVTPWKPVTEDPFQAVVRAQAEARPAGLGKRFAARLLDTLVLGTVTGVAAVPLGTRAIDHIDDKIDAAKLSGETVTVWLLDGTTSLYLGIVLAVLLVAGVLYEALPTAKWGRTLGKKVLGLEVRDIEGHDPPSFGLALRRWLVYSVPGLLAIGVVGVAWCLFDKPWRQCWHDKAAHTFVAG
ncbi:RDD family protein [Streptomyces sp. NPDC002845]